jgi:hypothetical protein
MDRNREVGEVCGSEVEFEKIQSSMHGQGKNFFNNKALHQYLISHVQYLIVFSYT